MIALPLDTECIQCGGPVTLAREVSVVRDTWDRLKPLESNADTINVERHLPTQFQLSSPKLDASMAFHAGYSNILGGENSRIYDPEPPYSPPASRSMFPGSPFSEQASSVPPQSLISPQTPYSPKFGHKTDTPHVEHTPPEDFTSSDGLCIDTTESGMPKTLLSGDVETPLSPAFSQGSQSRLQSVSSVSFETEALTRRRTVPLVAPPEKRKSRWRSKLTGSRKESTKPSTGDSSSLSSTTLESQRLEEFSLKSFAASPKASARGKIGKNINVYLSQNSTYALFWSQTTINVWDIGNSTPILGRAIATESNCLLAAVTKVYLAYIIGTRDQKLTVSTLVLIFLLQPAKLVSLASYCESHSDKCASDRVSHALLTLVY